MHMRRFIILGLAILVSFGLAIGPSVAQTEDSEGEDSEETFELRPPNYVSATYGFGLALPPGYMAFELDDGEIWMLEILGEMDEPLARMVVEALPEGVTDVIDYWAAMKERDQLMDRNITYEKVDSIADSAAILARIESMQAGEYILSITWVFVHEGNGFSLSAYPPSIGGGANLARDLGLELSQQFRWMSEEEIAEFEENPPEIEPGAGEEF